MSPLNSSPPPPVLDAIGKLEYAASLEYTKLAASIDGCRRPVLAAGTVGFFLARGRRCRRRHQRLLCRRVIVIDADWWPDGRGSGPQEWAAAGLPKRTAKHKGTRLAGAEIYTYM